MGFCLNVTRRWRAAYASAIGTAHLRTGTPCQDAGLCEVISAADGTEILVAAASDGAGAAPRSETGAALTVESFIRDFGKAAADDPSLIRIDDAFVADWIARVHALIGARAAEENGVVRDYACTLLGAVVTANGAFYLQIGDGAIVVGTEEPEAYAYVTWPQHGEYANVTNFLTDEDAPAVVQIERGPPVDEIALFTDGIERLVLDLANRNVHAPAFLPIFRWLRGCPPGSPAGPSHPLAALLNSERVNSRTDDDKTLVMATRRWPCWPLPEEPHDPGV